MDFIDEKYMESELVTGDKFKVFKDWCQREGVHMPKLEYPAYFENGLCGVKCLDEIKHREAFAFVPFKMVMSTGKAKNHPILGKVISENPDCFGE